MSSPSAPNDLREGLAGWLTNVRLSARKAVQEAGVEPSSISHEAYAEASEDGHREYRYEERAICSLQRSENFLLVNLALAQNRSSADPIVEILESLFPVLRKDSMPTGLDSARHHPMKRNRGEYSPL